MNDTSACPNNPPPVGKIRVWDAPVRVAHGLMILCFFGAYFTAESERWRLVHVTLGYSLFGLVVWRLLWGFVGTRYARFTEFVRGPRAVLAYLASLLRGKPLHYLGHNPAGALAILALLALSIGIGVSGYLLYNSNAGETLEEVHEVLANLMLGLVIVHVGAVLLSSHLHKENLLMAMLHGRKRGKPEDAIQNNWPLLAGLLLAAVLVFAYWQWQQAPRLAGNNFAFDQREQASNAGEQNNDDDDDDEDAADKSAAGKSAPSIAVR